MQKSENVICGCAADPHLTVKREILSKIKEYSTIVISRHQRPDGDAVGSTVGLWHVLRDAFPTKKIVLVSEDSSDYVSFLGDECGTVTDEEYAGALQIVCDCGNVERISNRRWDRAREIVKIDHHVDIAPYGDVSWVEDDRSSACEMICELQYTFRDELPLSREAALALYTGMLTDTGRFQYATDGRTLRYAAYLLDTGIDTEWLLTRLSIESLAEVRFRAYMTERIQMSESGVAWFVVDTEIQRLFGLTREQASESVSLLSRIAGSLVWIAFIENGDGSTRVRLRSRFFATNRIAEKYHGGGHECASGATVYSPEELAALVSDADAALRDYKATHEGWL